MLDLLRTAGMWRASVRYGYLFGALSRIKGGGNIAVVAQRGMECGCPLACCHLRVGLDGCA